MTRGGFWLMVATLALTALGGLALIVPSPTSLDPREVDCAEFLASPAPGRVRLLGCEVDLAYPSYHHEGPRVTDALFDVRPPGFANDVDDAPPRVVLYTDAPDLTRVAAEMHALGSDEGRRRRYAERHQDRLLPRMDLEGELVRGRHAATDLVQRDARLTLDTWVLDARAPRTGSLGALLLAVGLLGLLLLVAAQRRWARTRDRLVGGRPTTF